MTYHILAQIVGSNPAPVLAPLTFAGVASFLLQVLKKAKWFPPLSEYSSKGVKVAFAGAAAFASGIGVTYVWDPTGHTLLLSNLSLSAIGTSGFAWLQQYILQHWFYESTVHNGTTSAGKVGQAPTPADFVAPSVKKP